MINTGNQPDNVGDNYVHFGAVRVRVNGAGNLRMTFQSLDQVNTQALTPLPMATLTPTEPTRLANFITQRAFLRVETTQINEIFKIHRIVVFAKPIWTTAVV